MPSTLARIRDQTCPIAFKRMMKEFQQLERALGKLHMKNNNVPYVLLQPILGWRSSGYFPKKVTFKDLDKKGLGDPLTLYVYTSYWNPPDRNKQIADFLEVVEANKPKLRDWDFKLVYADD